MAAGLVVMAACALRAGLIATRSFDPDEFEHLHGGWCLAHGIWPYRDYFEHHTPWLHLALAPFFSFTDVDHRPGDAVAFILLARAAMWILATGALALVFVLARKWAGARTALVATAVAAVAYVFVGKTVEIRPDVPALACLLGSWILTLAALGRDPARPGARARLLAAGLLLGAALLFTQKVLFTGPATAGLFLWWLADGRQAGGRRARAIGIATFAAGVALPIAATLALFAAHSGARAFLEANFAVNAAWPRSSPLPVMRILAGRDTAALVLAAVGLLLTAPRLRRADAVTGGDALLVLQTFGLLAGAFVIPSPQLQYFLMAVPPLALLAARAIVELLDVAAAARARRGRAVSIAGTTAVAALALLAGAWPLVAMARGLDPSRPRAQDQLARIRLVLQTTAPDQTVMDGFTGAGVFRPHAYRYFFLHQEVREWLGAPEMGRLRAQLRDGEVAPEVVLYDDDLREMPPEITAFVEENYAPAGDALVWRRRDLALDRDGRGDGRLDVGHGPTDVLVGRGWSAPVERDGRWSRRTQGRRSTVRLPLREPADFLLTVHARPEGETPATPLGLAVNDVENGTLALGAGWADYTFAVPATTWRTGINRVRLT
ncbi:MAG TPA: hypothetical protein VGQ33_05225, partial [Vicinamibacteria bacterium]|nr:hypothetical protein [Vicinamibacteria bacterium]